MESPLSKYTCVNRIEQFHSIKYLWTYSDSINPFRDVDNYRNICSDQKYITKHPNQLCSADISTHENEQYF